MGLSRQRDESRRLLERGIARSALRQQLHGPTPDGNGYPLHYANQLARSTSTRRLDRLAKGWSGGTGRATHSYCVRCKRRGVRDPWHAREEGCPHA